MLGSLLLKNSILNKTEDNFLKNKNKQKQKHFVIQPYGSQSYPDVLIFFNKTIIPIEIKFTENKKTNPFWNSGIPRLNGIYIFGSFGLSDITFFLGKDVINKEELKKIDSFNEETDEYFKKFNQENLNSQKYGFHFYNRKAYQQGTKYNQKAITNFFDNENRKTLENKVINKLKEIE